MTVEASLDASLGRLGMSYVDIWCLHRLYVRALPSCSSRLRGFLATTMGIGRLLCHRASQHTASLVDKRFCFRGGLTGQPTSTSSCRLPR